MDVNVLVVTVVQTHTNVEIKIASMHLMKKIAETDNDVLRTMFSLRPKLWIAGPEYFEKIQDDSGVQRSILLDNDSSLDTTCRT